MTGVLLDTCVLIDALIAASALSVQAPLATLNRKHFPMLMQLIVPYS